MATDLQSDLSRLIGKCECAIRRGAVSQPDKLHTLQQKLVTAQDAPHGTRTQDQFQIAMHYYEEQIPKDVRKSNLAPLTNAFERVEDNMNIGGGGTPQSGSPADD